MTVVHRLTARSAGRAIGTTTAVVLAALLLVATTSALTIKATYQARYGSSGTVTLRQFTNGTGAAIVNLSALVPGRSYAFRLAIGSCASSSASSIPPRALKVSVAGKIAQTWTLSASQVASIASKLSSAKVVAVLASGSSRLCRTLTRLVSAPPGSSPTPTPPTAVVANVSTHRFGYGPTLTPASMADWFPALRLGVPASVTTTVAAGQNVYALFVVPKGGSVTFKVTSSSSTGGWYWQWNSVNTYWNTPELYFFEGQYVTLNGGTTWAFGLDYNTYAGPETLTILPTALTRP